MTHCHPSFNHPAWSEGWLKVWLTVRYKEDFPKLGRNPLGITSLKAGEKQWPKVSAVRVRASSGRAEWMLFSTTKHQWDYSGWLGRHHHLLLVEAGWTNLCQEWHTWRCWDQTLAALRLQLCSLARVEARTFLSQPSPSPIEHPLSFLLPSACRNANTRQFYEIDQSSEQHCLKYLPPSWGYKWFHYMKCKTGVKSPTGHRKYKIVCSDLKGLWESSQNLLKWMPQIRPLSPYTEA